MTVGWLDDLTAWLARQLDAFLDALVELLKDTALFLLESLLELIALAFEALPAVDLLQGYNLGALFGNAGPWVLWMAGNFRIAEALGLIGGAYAFRILRKLVTVGQW